MSEFPSSIPASTSARISRAPDCVSGASHTEEPGRAGWTTKPVRSAIRRGASVIRGLVRLPARALLAAVWLYQKTLSPALPVLLGPSCGCRFAPSCSHYAAEAIRVHGAVFGSALALRRLIKCTPLHPGGFDPVPPKRPRPTCQRATPIARANRRVPAPTA